MILVSCDTYNPTDDGPYTVVASPGQFVMIGFQPNPFINFALGEDFNGWSGRKFLNNDGAGDVSGTYNYVIYKTIDGTENTMTFSGPDGHQNIVLVYDVEAGYEIQVYDQHRATSPLTVPNSTSPVVTTLTQDDSDIAETGFGAGYPYGYGDNATLRHIWIGGSSTIFSHTPGGEFHIDDTNTSATAAYTQECHNYIEPPGFEAENIVAWDTDDLGISAINVDGTLTVDFTNDSTTGGTLQWVVGTRIIEICVPDPPVIDVICYDGGGADVSWVWPGPDCYASSIVINGTKDGDPFTVYSTNQQLPEDGNVTSHGFSYGDAGEYCFTAAWRDKFNIQHAFGNEECCTVEPVAPTGDYWGIQSADY